MLMCFDKNNLSGASLDYTLKAIPKSLYNTNLSAYFCD